MPPLPFDAEFVSIGRRGGAGRRLTMLQLAVEKAEELVTLVGIASPWPRPYLLRSPFHSAGCFRGPCRAAESAASARSSEG